ncbi:MAG: extracellular solute-binding protein [bacterium]
MGKARTDFRLPIYLFFFTAIILLLNAQYSILAMDTDISNYIRETQYREYLAEFDNLERPDLQIEIKASDFIEASDDVIVVKDFTEKLEEVIWTGERSSVEWEFEVPETGLYNIQINYYTTEGRGGDIEREININGSRPFEEAQYLKFTRVWENESEIKRDSLGNEIRPRQVEVPTWQEEVLKDSMGYEAKSYLFYFQEGNNTLSLISRNEPMYISSLKIFQEEEPKSFDQLKDYYDKNNFKITEDVFVKVQGQDAEYKSDSTLFPIADQGDPTLEPYHPSEIRLNSIGGHRWSRPGQWISWEVDVPEEGLYKIALKSKQNSQRGAYSNRKIYVNGEVPFSELEAVPFKYSAYYEMNVLGEEDYGEPFLFYLNKGSNEIKMEVVLGDMNEVIRQVENSLYQLNTIYRRIIMITSANPDPMRTYQIGKRVPELIEKMKAERDILNNIAKEIEDRVGETGEQIIVLDKFVILLDKMIEDPEVIPKSLDAYRDNIGALGTWLMDAREQSLQIDYLVVASPEEKMPSASPNFMQTMGHEMRAFVASFTHDYDAIGNMNYDEEEIMEAVDDDVLTVWLGTGRDQAQVLKRMIEDTFTPETGISVQLQLVSRMNQILIPATIAGTGPDLALGVMVQDPMNFAMRGAVVDLTQFDDFDDVAQRFQRSAFLPYRFRDSVYALPEKQSFSLLFYRKDVLAELGLEIPNTWEEVYEMMPVLQKNNMEFGLGSGIGASGVGTFLTFLYQQGGNFYKEDGVETNLDSELAISAFSDLTNLFTLYQLPITFNRENRFRMGEMPLMLSDYGLYNRLQVFAPELRGEWGFTLIPGTRQEDGSINRTVASSGMGQALSQAGVGGPGAVMLEQSNRKDEAWEFLKWWTSTDAQVKFGRELESLMGAAGRYPTANIEALKQLPWTVDERDVLLEQWDWVEGTREVPGSYYATRLFDWAFRAVVLDYETPRETLISYDRQINEEINIKRQEFGLVLNHEDVKEEWKKAFWSHFTHIDSPYDN